MDAKRAFDIAGSVAGLTLFFPLFAALAIAGAAHYRALPFYIVERKGKDDVPFRMIKFRTMSDAADMDGVLMPDTQRTDMYGRFLRGTALDELPQFANILKGDMSLVGPRPHYCQDDVPREILSVKPGLTGPWQVAAIGTKLSEQQRLALDLEYVQSAPSFSKDIKLMCKTLPALVFGHNGEKFTLGRR